MIASDNASLSSTRPPVSLHLRTPPIHSESLLVVQSRSTCKGFQEFLSDGIDIKGSIDFFMVCKESGESEIKFRKCGHAIGLDCLVNISQTTYGQDCPKCRTPRYTKEPIEDDFLPHSALPELFTLYPEICSILHCRRHYRTKDELRRHIRRTSDHLRCSKPGRCPIKAFSTDAEVEEHERTDAAHHPLRCPIIDCYINPHEFETHMRWSHRSTTFECPQEGCDRAFQFTTLRKYRSHRRDHAQELLAKEENEENERQSMRPDINATSPRNKDTDTADGIEDDPELIQLLKKPVLKIPCNCCARTFASSREMVAHQNATKPGYQVADAEKETIKEVLAKDMPYKDNNAPHISEEAANRAVFRREHNHQRSELEFAPNEVPSLTLQPGNSLKIRSDQALEQFHDVHQPGPSRETSITYNSAIVVANPLIPSSVSTHELTLPSCENVNLFTILSPDIRLCLYDLFDLPQTYYANDTWEFDGFRISCRQAWEETTKHGLIKLKQLNTKLHAVATYEYRQPIASVPPKMSTIIVRQLNSIHITVQKALDRDLFEPLVNLRLARLSVRFKTSTQKTWMPSHAHSLTREFTNDLNPINFNVSCLQISWAVDGNDHSACAKTLTADLSDDHQAWVRNYFRSWPEYTDQYWEDFPWPHANLRIADGVSPLFGEFSYTSLVRWKPDFAWMYYLYTDLWESWVRTIPQP